MITQLVKVEMIQGYYEVYAFDVTNMMMVSCGIYTKSRNAAKKAKSASKYFGDKAKAFGYSVPVHEFIPVLQIHI